MPSPFTFSIGEKNKRPIPRWSRWVKSKTVFFGRSRESPRPRWKEPRAKKDKQRSHNVSEKSSQRVPKTGFPFEPFLDSTRKETNSWLIGRSSSKSRTRSTLSSAATVRYILSTTRVSRVCGKVPSDRRKKRETYRKPDRGDRCTLMTGRRDREGYWQYPASDCENRYIQLHLWDIHFFILDFCFR